MKTVLILVLVAAFTLAGCASNSPSVPDQRESILSVGSTGLPVRRLQSRMSAVGFDTGGVDGRFGAKTQAAVKKLQQDYALTIDGVVGQQTWQVVDALENEGDAS